jgi:hypothetical protein
MSIQISASGFTKLENFVKDHYLNPDRFDPAWLVPQAIKAYKTAKLFNATYNPPFPLTTTTVVLGNCRGAIGGMDQIVVMSLETDFVDCTELGALI